MKISERVSELVRDYFFHIQDFQRDIILKKTVGRLMVLVLGILSDLALYLCKVS